MKIGIDVDGVLFDSEKNQSPRRVLYKIFLGD